MKNKFFRNRVSVLVSTATACFLLVYFIFYSVRSEPEWFPDNIVAFFIIFLFYFLHKKIEVTGVLYPLALLIVIFHNLGTFGFYSRRFIGVEWDTITHLYSGMVLSMIILHYFNKKLNIKTSMKIILTILGVMGINAISEILEASGVMVFGPGEGFFRYGNGDRGLLDTQTDLMHGFLGTLIGLGISSLILLLPRDKNPLSLEKSSGQFSHLGSHQTDNPVLIIRDKG